MQADPYITRIADLDLNEVSARLPSTYDNRRGYVVWSSINIQFDDAPIRGPFITRDGKQFFNVIVEWFNDIKKITELDKLLESSMRNKIPFSTADPVYSPLMRSFSPKKSPNTTLYSIKVPMNFKNSNSPKFLDGESELPSMPSNVSKATLSFNIRPFHLRADDGKEIFGFSPRLNIFKVTDYWIREENSENRTPERVQQELLPPVYETPSADKTFRTPVFHKN